MQRLRFVVLFSVVVLLFFAVAAVVTATPAKVFRPAKRLVRIVDHPTTHSSQYQHGNNNGKDDARGGHHQEQQGSSHDTEQQQGEMLSDFPDVTSWLAYHKRKRDQRQLEDMVQKGIKTSSATATSTQTGGSSNSGDDDFQPVESLVQRFLSQNWKSSQNGGGSQALTSEHYHYLYAHHRLNHRSGGAGHHGSSTFSRNTLSTPPPAAAISGGLSSCSPEETLRIDFTHHSGGDGKLYGNIWGNGYHVIQIGDYFEYEIMWLTDQCNCGVEIEVGVDWRLRDDAPLDAAGYSPHSERNSNMSAVAFRQWYRRRWSLPEKLAGQFVDKYVFSAYQRESALPARGSALFRNVVIGNVDPKTGKDEIKKYVWQGGQSGAPEIHNTFFKGSFATQCQPAVLVRAVEKEDTATAASSNLEAGEEVLSGSSWSGLPLRRGKTARLQFELDAMNVGGGNATSTNTAVGDAAINHNSTSNNNEQQQLPLLVRLFHQLAIRRTQHQSVDFNPAAHIHRRTWGPGSIFNRAQHSFVRQSAVLVLNFTARLKLASSSAAADVTLWDLLLLRARREQQQEGRNGNKSSNVNETEALWSSCRSGFQLPLSAATQNTGSSAFFTTRAGCLIDEIVSRRGQQVHVIDTAIADLLHDFSAKGMAVDSDLSISTAEAERRKRNLESQHNVQNRRLRLKKQGVDIHWDEQFMRALMVFVADPSVATDAAFPFLNSVELEVPGSEDALPFVHRLVGDENDEDGGAAAVRLSKKRQANSANEAAARVYAELELNVTYLVVQLAVTRNRTKTTVSSDDDEVMMHRSTITSSDLDDALDVQVREAKVVTATFGEF